MVEDQEKNTAQLAKIRAAMEQRWGLEIENKKKESGDNKEESKDSLRESQEEDILLSTFY